MSSYISSVTRFNATSRRAASEALEEAVAEDLLQNIQEPPGAEDGPVVASWEIVTSNKRANDIPDICNPYIKIRYSSCKYICVFSGSQFNDPKVTNFIVPFRQEDIVPVVRCLAILGRGEW